MSNEWVWTLYVLCGTLIAFVAATAFAMILVRLGIWMFFKAFFGGGLE